MKEHLLISLRMTVLVAAITCGLYPAIVLGVAQIAFRDRANGSFVTHDGRIAGSELIGQSFTSERFFHSRPSASDYDAMASGGTNLGPTSRKLKDSVDAAIKSYDVQTNVPADAVTSSGSGLDPHISPENAYAQSTRVARANGLAISAVRDLIARTTEERFAGIFGERRVNVLRLNLALMKMRRP